MATVASPSRARKARVPRPAPTPSPAPEPVAPAGPVARHGTCALWLSIGGVRYKLRPMPPSGEIRIIWTLSKIQPDPLCEPVAYAVAADGRTAHCTCPDHQHNGAACKHMQALKALRLIPPPEPAARPASSAEALPEGWHRGGQAPGPCRGCGVEISPAESYGRPGLLLCGDCFEREGGAL